MKYVNPSSVKGTVAAPPSKSMMGRTVAAALLAEGTTVIENASFCADALAAVAVIEGLGAAISVEGQRLVVASPGGAATRAKPVLDCRESGLSMRMFAPIAALADRDVTLVAEGSLRTRPMAMLEDLNRLGASCATANGLPPVSVRGPLEGGTARIDGSVSSQFLTGLLMALPLCGRNSRLLVSRLKSAPYVRMTMDLLRQFAVHVAADDRLEEFTIQGNQRYLPGRRTIEGDWSGASFLLVAGAIAGRVSVTGLNEDSAQADRAILEALHATGAEVKVAGNAVSVEARQMKAFRFDASDCPDLFPPLVALAAACSGRSVVFGLDRLAHKESDRAAALAAEFGRLGIAVRAAGNAMEIDGGRIAGTVVDSHNDHRIAMACAVAALVADSPIGIRGAGCVAKSYPAFFSDLAQLQERS